MFHLFQIKLYFTALNFSTEISTLSAQVSPKLSSKSFRCSVKWSQWNSAKHFICAIMIMILTLSNLFSNVFHIFMHFFPTLLNFLIKHYAHFRIDSDALNWNIASNNILQMLCRLHRIGSHFAEIFVLIFAYISCMHRVFCCQWKLSWQMLNKLTASRLFVVSLLIASLELRFIFENTYTSYI